MFVWMALAFFPAVKFRVPSEIFSICQQGAVFVCDGRRKKAGQRRQDMILIIEHPPVICKIAHAPFMSPWIEMHIHKGVMTFFPTGHDPEVRFSETQVRHTGTDSCRVLIRARKDQVRIAVQQLIHTIQDSAVQSTENIQITACRPDSNTVSPFCCRNIHGIPLGKLFAEIYFRILRGSRGMIDAELRAADRLHPLLKLPRCCQNRCGRCFGNNDLGGGNSAFCNRQRGMRGRFRLRNTSGTEQEQQRQ